MLCLSQNWNKLNNTSHNEEYIIKHINAIETINNKNKKFE